MHWVLQCLDLYYCLLYRCAVTVTISEHQWEVVVCCSRPSVVSCVIGHTHQLIRWRHYRAVAYDVTKPDVFTSLWQ